MHVDHVIFASGPRGIRADVAHLAECLGSDFREGGFHPTFGTRNYIMPLADSRYLEVVEVLDHPAAEKAPFGQAVRARSETGGGWLGWAVSVDDISPFEKRLERSAAPGSRQSPDGHHIEWRQLGMKGLMADPQLPFFLQWISDVQLRPTTTDSDLKLAEVQISGSADRLSEWLGTPVTDRLDGVHLNLIAPNGHPGITQVTFESPVTGTVVI